MRTHSRRSAAKPGTPSAHGHPHPPPRTPPSPDEGLTPGRIHTLTVRRFIPPGTIVGRGPSEDKNAPPDPLREVLIPSHAYDKPPAIGERLEVFVYLDAERRRLGALHHPPICLGEADFLEAVDTSPFGTFMHWGLPRDLLVPFKEHRTPMVLGERYAIALYLDESGRLAGTMRLGDVLPEGGEWEVGAQVGGKAWRQEDNIGLFVIIEKKAIGLLPSEEPHPLQPGDEALFRVVRRHPDGKIVLSLRARAHEELDRDGERILAYIRGPKAVPLGDHSSPERIREAVGMSKKAFKRAVGRLLKKRHVRLDERGYVRIIQERHGGGPKAGRRAAKKGGGRRRGA